MVVEVVGVSNFDSKAGNPCTVVHYLFSDPRVSGMAVDNCFVPRPVINNFGVPELGKYDISFNRQGYITSFVKVK